MNTCTVLQSAANSPAAYSVLRGLLEQDAIIIRAIVIDADDISLQFARSLGCEVFKAPLITTDEYIPFLLDLVGKENVNLFIPILEKELASVASYREAFRSLGCHLYIPSPQTIERTINKLLAYSVCEKNGIPFPLTFQSAEEALDFLPRPLFIKPADGVGALQANRIHDQDELSFWIKKIQNPVIQECIDGIEYTVDILATPNTIIGAVARERMQTKVGISVLARTVHNPHVVELACRAALAFEAVGPCNVQCFRTKDGRLLFSEINMRPAGTSILSIRAGFNFPLLLAKMACGMTITPSIPWPHKNLTMIRYWAEVFCPNKEGGKTI
jgi:carbamoyl-phosphate synthase large subunit